MSDRVKTAIVEFVEAFLVTVSVGLVLWMALTLVRALFATVFTG